MKKQVIVYLDNEADLEWLTASLDRNMLDYEIKGE